MRRAGRLAFVALLLAATATPHTIELPYDGRFAFVRLRRAGGSLSSRGWRAASNHDYPRAEQHLSPIRGQRSGKEPITILRADAKATSFKP